MFLGLLIAEQNVLLLIACYRLLACSLSLRHGNYRRQKWSRGSCQPPHGLCLGVAAAPKQKLTGLRLWYIMAGASQAHAVKDALWIRQKLRVIVGAVYLSFSCTHFTTGSLFVKRYMHTSITNHTHINNHFLSQDYSQDVG